MELQKSIDCLLNTFCIKCLNIQPLFVNADMIYTNKKTFMLSGLIQQTTNWFFVLFSPENWICNFMQIISAGDTLHDMPKPFFFSKEYFNMSSAKVYPAC